MKIEIFGDFHGCGYSRAAKTLAEEWLATTPYCKTNHTLVFKEIGLGDLRTFKAGGAPSAKLRPMLQKIAKADPSHNRLRTTMPAVFIGAKWLKEGYSGLESALKSLRCVVPSKKTPRRKTTKRRSRSKSRRRKTRRRSK